MKVGAWILVSLCACAASSTPVPEPVAPQPDAAAEPAVEQPQPVADNAGVMSMCRQVCRKGVGCQLMEGDKALDECVSDCLDDVEKDDDACHQALRGFRDCIGNLVCAEFESLLRGGANAKCATERSELEGRCDAKL